MFMIKILHTSDWHIGALQTLPYTIEYHNRKIGIRLFDTFKRIKKIIKYAINNNCGYVLITGDIFDNYAPNMYLKKYFSLEIKKLLEKQIHVIVLIGNHDTDGVIHAFSDIKYLLPNSETYLHIIDKFKTFIINNIAFHCIPYKPDIDYNQLLIDCVKKRLLKRDCYDILLAHFGVSGAIIGSGVRLMNQDVGINQLRGFDYVALGHYHIAQKIGFDVKQFKSNQIFYAGSLIKLDMNEQVSNDIKSFNVIKLLKDKKVIVKQINIVDRQYLKLQINFKQLKKIYNHKKMKINGYKIKSDSVIYFIVEALKSDAVSFNQNKFIKYFKEMYNVLFVTITWKIIKKVNKTIVNTSSIFDSTIQAFDHYIESFPLNKNEDEIKKLGHKIINSLNPDDLKIKM